PANPRRSPALAAVILIDPGSGKSVNLIARTPKCTWLCNVVEFLANYGRTLRKNKQSEKATTAGKVRFTPGCGHLALKMSKLPGLALRGSTCQVFLPRFKFFYKSASKR